MKDYIIPVGALVIAGVFAQSFFSGKSESQKEREHKNTEDAEQLEKDTIKSKLTYPLSKYTEISTSIKAASQGFQTNEKGIYRALAQVVNIHDWRYLQKVYLLRWKEPLIGRLQFEFTEKEQEVLNSVFKKTRGFTII